VDIAGTLARLRKKHGIMQTAVAEYLAEHTGKVVTKKAVSHWERGETLPSIPQFLLLCDLYQVEDIRFEFAGIESKHITRLNRIGKDRVNEYATMLARNPLFCEQSEAQRRPQTMKLFDLPVSAGTGLFLDSDTYEEIEVDESVPEGADFALRISGDSMTPRYIDRQIVFIHQQEQVELGEIGIFVLNEESYCKKLGQGKLISINTQYDPIAIHEYDSFTVLGKVVG
jgi:SOS-response transcriptional repressor LexA